MGEIKLTLWAKLVIGMLIIAVFINFAFMAFFDPLRFILYAAIPFAIGYVGGRLSGDSDV